MQLALLALSRWRTAADGAHAVRKGGRIVVHGGSDSLMSMRVLRSASAHGPESAAVLVGARATMQYGSKPTSPGSEPSKYDGATAPGNQPAFLMFMAHAGARATGAVGWSMWTEDSIAVEEMQSSAAAASRQRAPADSRGVTQGGAVGGGTHWKIQNSKLSSKVFVQRFKRAPRSTLMSQCVAAAATRSKIHNHCTARDTVSTLARTQNHRIMCASSRVSAGAALTRTPRENTSPAGRVVRSANTPRSPLRRDGARLRPSRARKPVSLLHRARSLHRASPCRPRFPIVPPIPQAQAHDASREGQPTLAPPVEPRNPVRHCAPSEKPPS